MSRVSVRSPELADRIVRLLQEGRPFIWFETEEARAAGLPATSTIRRWRIEDDAFDALCVRACEAHAETDYDRMEEMERRVLLPKNDPDHIDPYAASVVLGNTRWRMERRNPKRYGNKLEVKGHMTLEQLVLASQPAPKDDDE